MTVWMMIVMHVPVDQRRVRVPTLAEYTSFRAHGSASAEGSFSTGHTRVGFSQRKTAQSATRRGHPIQVENESARSRSAERICCGVDETCMTKTTRSLERGNNVGQ